MGLSMLSRFAAMLLTVTGVSTAAPPAASVDLLTSQPRLVAAADQITAAAAGSVGRAGITVDAEVGAVTVYWKGDLPADVRRAVDDQRRGGVRVEVMPAPYTEDELLAAAGPILADEHVTGVGPLPDGRALAVSVIGDARSAARLPVLVSPSVPVVIRPYEWPVFASGRTQDTAPYAGGSLYHFPLPDNYVGVCTTGFAVQIASTSSILSAGHCGHDGDTFYEGGSGTNVMGTVSGADTGHDTLLIDAPGRGEVFAGAYTSMLAKPVQEVVGNYPKTYVCTSGAVTGQHCDIRIVNTKQTIKIQDENGVWYTISDLVRAEAPLATVAAGEGDSGGPVVAQDSLVEGFALAYPLGTITAIDIGSAVACGSTFLPTTCSRRVFYADLVAALARYSAVIVQ